MAPKPLLLAASTVFTVLGVTRVLFPSYVPLTLPADIAKPLLILSEVQGLYLILLAAMYCTISRVGTTEAFLGVASAHLLFFFGTLYLWPDLLAAGLTARMLGYSLTFHGLVSLLTLSSASTGGKVAGAKSHMYGFTLLLCTVHFGIFLWMLACPQCFAEDVLNYKTVTVSSAALFANIRLESFVHAAISSVLCTNARQCSRPFALGMATSSALFAAWSLANSCLFCCHKDPASASVPSAGSPCECVITTLGVVHAFVAFYYFMNAPASAAIKAVKQD